VLAELEAEDRTAARRLADDLPLFAVRPPGAPAAPAADPAAAAVIAALTQLHPDEMSPRDALEALYTLKRMAAPDG
jgi:DNA mismatch repair protein MutS